MDNENEERFVLELLQPLVGNFGRYYMPRHPWIGFKLPDQQIDWIDDQQYNVNYGYGNEDVLLVSPNEPCYAYQLFFEQHWPIVPPTAKRHICFCTEVADSYVCKRAPEGQKLF
ncbi:unnamed protein product [Toxocara canis]|uniref:Uncharacterized protein n=1 Tax=Toxocara canis TaxID=6265 RepID=A0A183UW50_TOXCA|nr:unnamed protein product [Toxocara canis]